MAVKTNDVYLVEPPSFRGFYISREHFEIEHIDGQLFLVDRNSTCGTLVAATRVGGNRTGGRTELRDGDVIILGTPESPYRFRFEMNCAQTESESAA